MAWARASKESGHRARVFCASLADWLDNQAPYEWKLDLAMLVEATPELDWLLLTKRIENFDDHSPWLRNELPSNVWLGVTCEDQMHYERRWRLLREIPARIRFISHEPSLGCLWDFRTAEGSAPDWVICGGESGRGARVMDPDWARITRDNCAKLGIAFFMKQMTEKTAIPNDLLVRQFPATPPLANASPRIHRC